MKYILLFVFPLLFIGTCETRDNKGYPKRVEFASSGGTVTVTGRGYFSDLIIYDGNGDGHGSYVDDDSVILSYGWLKAKSSHFSPSVTIIVESNNTGRKRKLDIFGYFTTEYAVIKVEQGP